jgi:hypothetical protein
MTHTGLNGDLPRVSADDPADRLSAVPVDAGEAGAQRRPPKDVAALRAALATTHARYRRALREAERAPDAATRRAAFAEARQLVARATRLDARLRDP